MWRLIVVTFAMLGWAFYELSGGADFKPASQVAAASEADKSPVISPVISTRATRVAEVRPAAVQAATRRPALTTPSNKPAARSAPGDAQVTLASVQVPIAAPRDPNRAFFTVLGKAPRREAEVTRAAVAAAPEPQPAATDPDPDIRIVTKPRVNMRGGPGTNFEVVGKLYDGDEVAVLEDQGTGWVKLEVLGSGEIGWMADFLLTAAN